MFKCFGKLWRKTQPKISHIQTLKQIFNTLKIPKVQQPIIQILARTRQDLKYEKYSLNIKLQLSCLQNLMFSTKILRIIELKMDNCIDLAETLFQ